MKKTLNTKIEQAGSDFFGKQWEYSWTYIKTVVDVVREPVLILDKDFKVMAANAPFYKIFQVEEKDTAGKIIYQLGNGQWNIPDLKKLLEKILPENTFFKSFEVAHNFPGIGRKVMILNARQIYINEGESTKEFPSIIMLAIEDVTDMLAVADKLSAHMNKFELDLSNRTHKLEMNIEVLEKEIKDLKLARK